MPFDLETWAKSPLDDQMRAAEAASAEDLRDMALGFNWTIQREPVLACILDKQSISMATATTAFFNADPERFNYIPHRQLPETLHATTRLLDWVCDRINTGGYAHARGEGTPHTKRIRKWLDFQKADIDENTRGRWVLMPERLTLLMADPVRQTAESLADSAVYTGNRHPRASRKRSGRALFQIFDWRGTDVLT